MGDSEDDTRSGLGSMDDGDEFNYQDEGADMGSNNKDGVIENQPHDEALSLDGSSDDESVPSPSSQTNGADTLGASGGGKNGEEEVVENQPFDEAISISDDESVMSQETGSKASPDVAAPRGQGQQNLPDGEYSIEGMNMPGSHDGLDTPTRMPQGSDSSSSESDSDSDLDGGGFEEGETKFTGEEGGYDPKQFENLDVAEEIRNLFDYIGRYNPHKMELEPVLQPFIPDYVPAVGDIDAFIKLPRPDGKVDNLGVTVLDEPALNLSDPGALEIQLRHSSKTMHMGDAVVRSIDAAENNPKAIKAWVASIEEVHKKKPPQEVTYSKVMPDIESLMQVWPPQFEDELARCQLPSPQLDLSLEDYARIVCALFDIPVHDSITESLHVLFTLYSEFKNNDHFRNEMDAAAGNNGMNNDGGFQGMGGMGDSMLQGNPVTPGAFGDAPNYMGNTMGGLPGDPALMIGGNALSPLAPPGGGGVENFGDPDGGVTFHNAN